jgi:hypothetical protein
MMLVFGILGSLGALPAAAQITAVALGGMAIAVMLAANIIDDVAIARRMFSAPDAYLYALTPAPRWKTLLSSLTAMTVMDAVTLTVVISGEVWLVFNMVDEMTGIRVGDFLRDMGANILPALYYILYFVSAYLLFVLVVLFSVSAGKSIFYKKAASGLLAFLLAWGCLYISSLLQLVSAPFGTVARFGPAFTITVGHAGAWVNVIMTLIQVAVLFVLTSKLLERKVNI